MKKFLLNLFFLVTALVILFLLFEYSTSTLIGDRLQVKKEGKDIKYFVVGHSHSEIAYNDTIIKELKNISYAGESYLSSYYKAKILLKNNPHIDTIFVELSNNYLDKHMDEWIWGSDFLLMGYLDLSSTVSAEDKWWLFKKNPSGFLAASSLAGKVRLKRIRSAYYDFDYAGGFRYLKRDKTDSLLKAIVRNAPDTIFAGTAEKFSTQNLRFLKKLVEFCEDNEIKIYLIRSPLHSFYREHLNEKLYYRVLETDLKGVEFLDFSRFPLSNTEFGDLSHLNYKGTRKYSIWLDSLLQSGFLDKKNKQEIIDKEFDRINSGR
ncbi:hypothetical protein RM545_08240 [Zunongwangia sp. F260]|uniref:SGNH/GDSL hydrolase family protein n=1 Tax=Autumnicola lenta TaxID=3075593 RepID=A0ABU3CKB2_9FLAO|nr:hypothetical protein [Zunongwangia sp. F260]MDT0646677.1 hypothetical protein [Zunongwangia sp. F260]